MALNCAQILLVLTLFSSTFALGMANKNFTMGPQNWNFGFNYSGWPFYHPNATNFSSKKIVVGGSEGWHYGFNYTDWAIKNGPFYWNDTLVFKFAAPNATTPPHSVYQLPNLWSYQNCDLRGAKRIATPTQGGGKGFEFVLNNWQTHYFACGERGGLHCNNGTMKFFVVPLIRWFF